MYFSQLVGHITLTMNEGGGLTNPYIDSLLDGGSPASKEPMYGCFTPVMKWVLLETLSF